MPNWVTNILNVKGHNVAELNDFVNKVRNGEEFDFDKLIPRPKSLNMTSGGQDNQAIMAYLTDNCSKPLTPDIIDKAVKYGVKSRFDRGTECIEEAYKRTAEIIAKESAYKKYNFSSDGVSKNELTLFDAGKIYVSNVDKFGCRDWYDWCCENWGTKWNAQETEFSSIGSVTNPKTKEITYDIDISFNTAWSAPFPVFYELCSRFESLYFELRYADEDFGSNTGKLIGHHTEIEEWEPSSIKAGQEFAAEILGIDLDEEYEFSEKEESYVYKEAECSPNF